MSWSSYAVNVDEAFEYIENKNIMCSEVTVAVIDTGIYSKHEYFNNSERLVDSGFYYETTVGIDSEGNKITEKQSSMEDDCFHGTAVSSVIYDNTMSIVKITPYRVTNSIFIRYSNMFKAFDFAVSKNVDIINISAGGEIPGNSKTLYDKITSASNNGIMVIVASGNENKSTNTVFPACHPDVITVSATDENSKPASFSNFGNTVDVSAPGTNIKVPVPRLLTDNSDDSPYPAYNAYMISDGTSYSAPLIAAAAATLKSIDPDITPAETKRIIKETAYVPEGWDTNYGVGIVNFYNMVKAVLEPEISCQPLEIRPENGKIEIIAPEGTDARIYYTIDGSVPTIDNHIKYTEPVSFRNNYIKKITAVCHENGKLISEPITYGMINHREKTIFCKWSKELPSYENSGDAIWYSRNPEIASVDDNGKITGVSPGNTDIICRYPTGEWVTWNIKVQYSPIQLFFIICFFGFLWI